MFDRNIYCLGQTAQVLTDCDNCSTVGVRSLNVRLERRVELQAPHR